MYARSDQGGWWRKTRRGSKRKGVVGERRKRKGALFGRGSGNVLIATSSNAYKKKLFSSPLRHPRFSFLLTFKIPPFFFRLPSPLLLLFSFLDYLRSRLNRGIITWILIPSSDFVFKHFSIARSFLRSSLNDFRWNTEKIYQKDKMSEYIFAFSLRIKWTSVQRSSPRISEIANKRLIRCNKVLINCNYT